MRKKQSSNSILGWYDGFLHKTLYALHICLLSMVFNVAMKIQCVLVLRIKSIFGWYSGTENNGLSVPDAPYLVGMVDNITEITNCQ